MDVFSQKLELIYKELFNENIDNFSEALVDYTKFNNDRFDGGSESENRQQFLLNRKTVLRRWLQKGSTCTSDFQKSFYNYKLAHLQLQGSALFTLNDFKEHDNLELFNEKIEKYLQKQQRTYIQTEYKYIYNYCELHNEIYYYEIIQWIKDERGQKKIKIKRDEQYYNGTFSLSDENNIFITLYIEEAPYYLLFHETNDKASPYIVGVNMGFMVQDNKVPRSQKVIFAKELLDIEALKLDFILNETEVLTAIENRLNPNAQEEEVKVNHFVKYAHKLRKYFNFFQKLSQKQYKQFFYYRLAFREFCTIKKLFKKVSKEESYYIFDYPRAFLELLNTIERIQDISLQIVMQLGENNLFLQTNKQSREIKKKFLHLPTSANIKINIIFVIEEADILNSNSIYLLNKMIQKNIEVRLIQKKVIANIVDSLDFSFIHLNDSRDFVLADPIRDSKDVYKLFIDELTMDEYRTDYQRFLEKSKVYNTPN
jgi:hypothetical protein